MDEQLPLYNPLRVETIRTTRQEVPLTGASRDVGPALAPPRRSEPARLDAMDEGELASRASALRECIASERVTLEIEQNKDIGYGLSADGKKAERTIEELQTRVLEIEAILATKLGLHRTLRPMEEAPPEGGPSSEQYVDNARVQLAKGKVEAAFMLLTKALELQGPRTLPDYEALKEIMRPLGNLGTWDAEKLERIEYEVQGIVERQKVLAQEAFADDDFAASDQHMANARAAQDAIRAIQLCILGQNTFEAAHATKVRLVEQPVDAEAAE